MEPVLSLGIDLGGTKIHAGVVDGDGKILNQLRRPTEADREPDAIVGNIAAAAQEAVSGAGLKMEVITGVGIGSPGPMNIETGVLLNENNLPTFYDYPIVDRLSTALDRPVVLDNDANVLGLAEARFGAGKGSKVCCGFTLGTGLGGFVVIDGHVLSGPRGAGAEIWCSPYCGDFIEERVSGKGMARIYKKLSGTDADAREVEKRAFAGEAVAIEAWREFGRDLAVPIAWVSNTLDADVVIIGGSIMKAWDLFSEAMREHALKYVNPITRATLRIVPAALGDEAGMLGAAALVLDRKQRVHTLSRRTP